MNPETRSRRWQSVKRYNWKVTTGIHEIGKDNFPEKFKQVKPPCHGLRQAGTVDITTARREQWIAIVGSRAIGQKTSDFTYALANGLGRAGWTVVSGLARGVDSSAHQGCLASGAPTVAVVGSGLGQLNKSSQSLAQRIVDNGCLLSEYEHQQKTTVWQLVNRSRLVVALSSALVMVDGKCDSGTMYAVRDAWRMGIPVYATKASAAGQVLLEQPESRLPDLLKQFRLNKEEKSRLLESPLARPLNELDHIWKLDDSSGSSNGAWRQQ